VNLILSLVASGIAAYLSWSLVESRILKRKASIATQVDLYWVRSWLFAPRREWHDWYASTPVYIDGFGLTKGSLREAILIACDSRTGRGRQ
jgi:hypothetical protein